MKEGYLSQYFEGIAIKYLSAVETDANRSHQHEFNGVAELKKILGEPSEKKQFEAHFLFFSDQDDEPISDTGFLTWYDARRKAREKRGVMRYEYRLYFPDNSVYQCASENDMLVIAKRSDGTLLAIVAENGSTIEHQIKWLFGFYELTHLGFSVKSELETEQDRIGFAARVILEQIGVEIKDEEPNYLDDMLAKFSGDFPQTAVFSDYARNTMPDVSSLDDPDNALLVWMEREEILFRTLEKHLLANRLHAILRDGNNDTDLVIATVQSILQRRKSRAGYALENHLARIFDEYDIICTRSGITENRSKPDFIFPNIECYRDSNYLSEKLTMLASKSTCKDRWRQILNEAARIPDKHLITLEPGISENQTKEMQTSRVQLVIPTGLHSTYTKNQQAWLMNVAEFVSLVKERQKTYRCGSSHK